MTSATNEILHLAQRYIARGPAQIGGLILGRIVPIAMLTPLFGGSESPKRFRSGIAIILTLVLLPGFSSHFGESVTASRFALLMAKELVLGLGIAVVVIIIFELIAAAGTITDLLRDSNLMNIFDPMSSEQTSVLSLLLRRLTVLFFFVLGGDRILIAALGSSFTAFPLTARPPGRDFDAAAPAAIIAIFADMLIVAVQLAAPIIVLMLAVELAVGMASRVAGSIDLSTFKSTTKLLLGLWAFVLVLGYGFEKILGRALDQLIHYIAGA